MERIRERHDAKSLISAGWRVLDLHRVTQHEQARASTGRTPRRRRAGVVKKSSRKKPGAVMRSTSASHEQRGEKRAGYGARVIEGLAKRLAGRVGKGLSVPNLRNMRHFYLTYPEGSALPGALGGAASRPEKRSALPSVSASLKIRSAVPGESRRGTRTAALTETAGVPAPFPPYLGWTHYLLLMRVGLDPLP